MAGIPRARGGSLGHANRDGARSTALKLEIPVLGAAGEGRVGLRVETFGRRGPRSWNTITRRVSEIELECFGEHAFSDEELRVAFNKHRNLVVLLWDGPTSDDDLLVGYTQAEPARVADTYYIANTAIAKSHQRRGLVKLLMKQLYADIRASGAHYVARDVAIENGYADNIVRLHAADILETFDHDSPYGPQRFIRMRVPEP